MKQIYLFPGQWAHSREPAEIATILGSCVAVALHDVKRKTGALNHYLLSTLSRGEPPSPRYGEIAIPAIIDAMLKDGSDRKSLRAKVYGGGSVLSGVTIGDGIGNENVDFAIRRLQEQGIPIIEQNVRGTRGRRIALRTDTFDVKHVLQGDSPRDRESQGETKPIASHAAAAEGVRPEVRAIVIGGNSGSAASLKAVLEGLPGDTPPVVVAHGAIAAFLESHFAALKSTARPEIHVAKHGEMLKPGVVYLIPADHQARVSANLLGAQLEIRKEPAVAGQAPSANVLFESAAHSFRGGLVAVLLGGFGNDGLEGLQKVRLAGGTSIVESPSGIPFPQSPQKAIDSGLSDQVFSASQISVAIRALRSLRSAPPVGGRAA